MFQKFTNSVPEKSNRQAARLNESPTSIYTVQRKPQDNAAPILIMRKGQTVYKTITCLESSREKISRQTKAPNSSKNDKPFQGQLGQSNSFTIERAHEEKETKSEVGNKKAARK